ncbi:hypothetical protein GOBAR_AA16493 [Gossypium barbadense]|uniref:C2H2-type domain-containing protein n=1 Tax=Gossypium barbadense TaxID=3634 RepID=A0A2P5XLL1_GOSBA|nr:hypothetical protein GOBAR_AA16493 [Gossypium barbadense]
MEKGSDSIETSDSVPLKPNNNKLMVKLKISKKRYGGSGGGGGDGGGQHVCPVCSKGFTSGKALGGHVRIHMKANKNGGRYKKISKRQPRNNNNNNIRKKIPIMAAVAAAETPHESHGSEEKVSCCICKKDFKSLKSLFGHMRNHPERNWRGIRPPPSDKNSCCSSVSENDEAVVVDQIKGSASDLLKSLPKWTTTTKRFEKSTHNTKIHKTPLKTSFYTKNPKTTPLKEEAKQYYTKNNKTQQLDFDLNEPYIGEDSDDSDNELK